MIFYRVVRLATLSIIFKIIKKEHDKLIKDMNHLYIGTATIQGEGVDINK